MKKNIMNLINSESDEGICFRLNNVSYLKRWTRDALGNDVDKLVLEFDNINNVNFSLYDKEIKSRDYDGIISECQQITETFFAKVSKTLVSNLKTGYRNVSRTTV